MEAMRAFSEPPAVRINNGDVYVGERRLDLKGVRSVSAVPSRKMFWPFIVVLFVAPALAFPLTSSWISTGRADGPPVFAMAISAAAVFFAIFRLLTFADRYEVVVDTSAGEKTLLSSEDYQLVISVVAAIERARRRNEFGG